MTAALLACIISGAALAVPVIRTLRQFDGFLRPAIAPKQKRGNK